MTTKAPDHPQPRDAKRDLALADYQKARAVAEAAPMMLAALKDILQADFLSPEARRDAVRRAGAAIAAAEGKTP